jgi:hypothetical protein
MKGLFQLEEGKHVIWQKIVEIFLVNGIKEF